MDIIITPAFDWSLCIHRHIILLIAQLLVSNVQMGDATATAAAAVDVVIIIVVVVVSRRCTS